MSKGETIAYVVGLIVGIGIGVGLTLAICLTYGQAFPNFR
jgi:hypothetical protein